MGPASRAPTLCPSGGTPSRMLWALQRRGAACCARPRRGCFVGVIQWGSSSGGRPSGGQTPTCYILRSSGGQTPSCYILQNPAVGVVAVGVRPQAVISYRRYNRLRPDPSIREPEGPKVAAEARSTATKHRWPHPAPNAPPVIAPPQERKQSQGIPSVAHPSSAASRWCGNEERGRSRPPGRPDRSDEGPAPPGRRGASPIR